MFEDLNSKATGVFNLGDSICRPALSIRAQGRFEGSDFGSGLNFGFGSGCTLVPEKIGATLDRLSACRDIHYAQRYVRGVLFENV